MDERRSNSTSKQKYTQRYYHDVKNNRNDIGSQEKISVTRAYSFRISLIRGHKLTHAQKVTQEKAIKYKRQY
jgi:hypothetical protein